MASRKTVLVVEDEPDNRELIKTLVEDIVGYQAVLAETGRQALASVQADVPDLVLLDLMIPEVDGFTVVRHLRADARTAQVPVIAITALARARDREQALAAGCNDFVDKPFDLDQLAEKIQAFTGG